MIRCVRWAAALAAFALAAPAHAIFDNLELSPRARALGGSYSGLSADATGIAYNPAGLSALEERDVHVSTFAPFGADFARVNFVAIAFPTPKWGTFGAGYSDFRVDYQDATPAGGTLHSGRNHRVFRQGRRRNARAQAWEPDRELGSPPWPLARGSDAAPVQLDQLAHQGEADAQAAVGAVDWPFRLHEEVEHLR